MAWKDQLRPASFRDVPFQVEADDMTAGRRVQVFEYPQRDKPFTEDLGRAAREINITAYVIGPDYLSARDALLQAIESPGPGTLVHPWYGTLQVVARPGRVTHSQQEGGMCRFSLVFVESGELEFPTAKTSPGDQSRKAADMMSSTAVDDFAAIFSVDGFPSFVSVDALDKFSAALNVVQGVSGRAGGILQSPVSGLIGELSRFASNPRSLAQQVMGLFSQGRMLSATVSGWFGSGHAANQRALSVVTASVLAYPPVPAPSLLLSPSRQQISINESAINALMRRALLMQATSMIADMDLPVYDDAVTLRRDLVHALDTESLTATDEVYQALQTARVAVYQDVTGRLSSASRLIQITPVEPVPALVLSYDLYEDISRDGEITSRNRIKHPGFIPAEPLKVLAS